MNGPLQAGDIIGHRYMIEKYLDKGGMQYVYVANDKLTGRQVALKTPQNASATKRFRRSAIVAAKVNHPNVAKTLDYVKEGDSRYLIEELIRGKDLRAALLDKADFTDPFLAAKIFHHLSKGVAAAHHAGVIHRDLKPTNIMVVGDFSLQELKITDFGIAKMAEEVLQEAVDGGEASMTTSQTAVGALPYMAPEAIEDPKKVKSSADIWSVGAMMYHLMTGNYPFGQGLKAVPKIINAEKPPTPNFITINPQFSPLACEIMKIIFKCLEKEPSNRPTADALVGMCSNLCYTVDARQYGRVNAYYHNAYGFITSENGNVFFHKDSVYGRLPIVGERVIFSSYSSGDAPRALPVLALKK